MRKRVINVTTLFSYSVPLARCKDSGLVLYRYPVPDGTKSNESYSLFCPERDTIWVELSVLTPASVPVGTGYDACRQR